MPSFALQARSGRSLALLMLGLALAACQPVRFVSETPDPTRVTSASLVHDGGIVFAKGYPAPRIENPLLVPIFATRTAQAPDLEAGRKLLALTNGQKTGFLPDTSTSELGVERASAFGLLAASGLLGAMTRAGTGAASPAAEGRYVLAHVSTLAEVPFFVRRPETSAGQHVLALPLEVDLRTVMPPVRDQGRRNTGVAFATAAILDYLASHDPNLPLKHASPQFLNWRYQIQIKSKLQNNPSNVWTARDTSQTLFYSLLHIDGNPTPSVDAPYVPPLQGDVGEEACPYLADLSPLPADTNVVQAARLHLGDTLAQKVVDHETLVSQGAYFYRLNTDAGTYEAALSGGQPIALSLPVYLPDWAHPDVANHYRLAEMTVEKAQDTSQLAYQAAVIVGYTKDASAPGGGWFLLRNSWGSGWGDGGHVRVSYRTIMQFGYSAHIAVGYAKPFAGVYDVFPPPLDASQDIIRALPPITDTAAWGAYTALTAAKEGDDIKNVPAPPIPVNALGLPVALGNEGDVYADDKNHPGAYQGPGAHGAEEPLSQAPGLAPLPAPATAAPATPVPATPVPATPAPALTPSSAATPVPATTPVSAPTGGPTAAPTPAATAAPAATPAPGRATP